MNRVPARGGQRRSTNDLERKVTALSWLVGLQVVLLLVLVGFEVADLWAAGARELSDRVGLDSGNPSAELAAGGAMHEAAGGRADQQAAHEPGDVLPPEAEPIRPVRIEILNGCGVNGLAASYARILRNAGFDVRDTRNADRLDYEHSRVIDRGSLPGAGLKLASELGIPADSLRRESDPGLVDVDVTLILGNDYKTLKLQP
ncbi:MAG: hypothetical protein MAG453_01800 [Calditrichaeota bacterium]|nr:hypothetical protein [Calditrichota bacterium]